MLQKNAEEWEVPVLESFGCMHWTLPNKTTGKCGDVSIYGKDHLIKSRLFDTDGHLLKNLSHVHDVLFSKTS